MPAGSICSGHRLNRRIDLFGLQAVIVEVKNAQWGNLPLVGSRVRRQFLELPADGGRHLRDDSGASLEQQPEDVEQQRFYRVNTWSARACNVRASCSTTVDSKRQLNFCGRQELSRDGLSITSPPETRYDRWQVSGRLDSGVPLPRTVEAVRELLPQDRRLQNLQANHQCRLSFGGPRSRVRRTLCYCM